MTTSPFDCKTTHKKNGVARCWLAIPGILVSLLPQLYCPLCWPAYTALLSSLGFGFINYTPYLLPTMVLLLLIALCSLAFRAKKRQGYKPFWLGVVAVFIIMLSKFVFKVNFMLYLGIAILLVASLWNIFPSKTKVSCC